MTWKFPKKILQFFRLRSFYLIAFVVIIFLSGGWLLMKMKCADMISWGVSHVVPGTTVELNHVHLTSLHHLVLEGLVIRDRKSGEELLKIQRATVNFAFQKLFNFKINEIRLSQPVISISSRTLELFSFSDDSKKRTTKPFPLEFTRIVCEEGEIRMSGLGDNYPEIQAKFCLEFRDFTWSAPQVKRNILLWEISAQTAGGSPFLELDRMEVFFSLQELGQNCLDRVHMGGGKFIIGKQLRELMENTKKTTAFLPSSPRKKTPSLPSWVVSNINVDRVTVALEEENPGMSQIQFQLTTRLKNITIEDAANKVSSVSQTVQLSNISLRAPSGRKVMTFPTIFARFTLQDLLQEQIEEVVVLYPTIYLSEDLFAYMDSISSKESQPGNVPFSTSNWAIRKLKVDFGNLMIGASEDEGVGLPLKFETSVDNISLRNLAALKIQGQLRIPEEKYEFASYQLECKSKSGEMYFSYPPAKGNNNIVTVLKFAHLRWRQYEFQEPWMGVTFDQKGINGTFGAKAYKGYVSGGFSFFFRNYSPWIAWVGGRKIDLYPLTKIISPKDFTMTGSLNLALQINAQGRSIERVKGSFQAGTPGKVHVGKIESLLKNLPTDWPALKRSAATIALETLQDFEYKKALGDFWFVDSQGILNFNLVGSTGSRKLKFVVHNNPYPSHFWNSSTAVQ